MNYSTYVLLLPTFGILLGCGSSSDEIVEARRTAIEAYETGSAALEKGDFRAALDAFNEALSTKGLNADLLGEAQVKKSVCLAAIGKVKEAHLLLDVLERMAPNLGDVYAARSFVFVQENKLAEAKAAWSKARRIDPLVRKFGE